MENTSEYKYRDMECILCDKKIVQIYTGNEEKPYEGCWNDGTVGVVSMGYGSLLDGNMYLICVCDTCLKKKHKEGKIDLLGNYIFD